MAILAVCSSQHNLIETDSALSGSEGGSLQLAALSHALIRVLQRTCFVHPDHRAVAVRACDESGRQNNILDVVPVCVHVGLGRVGVWLRLTRVEGPAPSLYQ